MYTLRDVTLNVHTIPASMLGEQVYRRFDADPDLMVIGVVDDHGSGIGLIERSVFTLKLGSTYGRSLYAGRPVSLVMDLTPLRVEADALVSDFAEIALARKAGDFSRGYLVEAEGRLLGAGSVFSLVQIIAQENREQSRKQAEVNAVLRATEHRAQSAHKLLTGALDAMSEGVAIFDEDDRCVLWNSKYALSHRESADVFSAGLSFETLLRQGVERGQYVQARGREQEWLALRLSRRAALVNRASEEQELPDGRFLRVEDTPLQGGGLISVAVDITDFRRREASFRLLFESNPVPLLVVDRADCAVLAANAAAGSYFGYPVEALSHLSLARIIVEDDFHAAQAAVRCDGAQLYAGETSWRFLTSSGERVHALPYMHPLTYEGRPATLLAAADISAQHRAEAALKAALLNAEDADRAKTEFLANMSHELRTPLNGVVGMTSVLARTPLTSEQSEIVKVIQTSAATLHMLVSDVLDLAKIEAGRIDLQADLVSPAALARHVATLFSEPAAEKGLDFVLELAENAADAVLADSVRLAQVLTNLCSNAIKFTAKGCVRLAVRSQLEAASRRVTFVVSDTGIGISEGAREKIFDRFAQADGSITRRFGGTGLGLAISHQLVTLMGGDICVASAEGQGSTFTVTLDLPCTAESRLQPRDDGQAGSGVADAPPDLRVLLVEDHPVNRKVIQLMLAGHAELDTAQDGAEGVEAVLANAYDVILMDMQMPVMDGLSATQAIRAWETESGRGRTPIIMLTANAMAEHIGASRSAGADAHLTKPVQAEALFDTIVDVLNRQDALAAEAMAA